MSVDDLGINVGRDDYEYYAARIYTRIREDRLNRKGSTPTKFKISLSDFFFLPQVHPAIDIPYTYAKNIISQYIGKPVYDSHNYEGEQIGFVAHANLTDNPAHTLSESDKDISQYMGKSMKFHSVMATLALRKNKLRGIRNNSHVRGIEDLDCSIGYRYCFDIDDGDIHFERNGWIDAKKTLLYAKNFTWEECSVCDHGHGACEGSKILQRLSKTDLSKSLHERLKFTPKLLNILGSRAKKMSSSLSASKSDEKFLRNFKNDLETLIQIAKKLPNKINLKFIKKVDFKEFSDDERKIILKNIKYFNTQNIKKKKTKLGGIMSDDVGNKKEDTEMKNTKAAQIKELGIIKDHKSCTILSSKGSGVIKSTEMQDKMEDDDEFNTYVRSRGINNEKDEALFARFVLKKSWAERKEYEVKAKENLEDRRNEFQTVLGIANNDKKMILDEELKTQFDTLATNPDMKKLSSSMNKIFEKFVSFSKKNEGSDEIKGEKRIKKKKSIYYKPEQNTHISLYTQKQTTTLTKTPEEERKVLEKDIIGTETTKVKSFKHRDELNSIMKTQHSVLDRMFDKYKRDGI